MGETTAAATVAETTAAAVAESTAAAVAETTVADVAESTVADVVETTPTATVAESTVANVTDPDAHCDEAKGALEAAANETEKTALKTACDLACADVEEARCGFLVNGVSFVLFAILAVFKY